MEEKENPIALITLNEICALSAILQFYERFMWNATAPSVKRSQRYVEVYALIVKLFLLPTEQAAIVTQDEISYIKTALGVFTTQVVDKIPPSESRDGILASCMQLQTYIDAVFSSQH